MPAESPEQFELNTLEMVLRSLDHPNEWSTGKLCAIFGGAGVFLIVIVYFLHGENWVSSYFLYFLCVLSGICLAGAGIVQRLNSQARLTIRYIDRDAIIKRIGELRM